MLLILALAGRNDSFVLSGMADSATFLAMNLLEVFVNKLKTDEPTGSRCLE